MSQVEVLSVWFVALADQVLSVHLVVGMLVAAVVGWVIGLLLPD